MGWEFAAVWAEEPDSRWEWVWRRVADHSGALLEESSQFPRLADCIAHAKRYGFDDDDCPTS